MIRRQAGNVQDLGGRFLFVLAGVLVDRDFWPHAAVGGLAPERHAQMLRGHTHA